MRSSTAHVSDAYVRYGPSLVRKAERMLRSPSDAEDVVHALFTEFLSKPPRSLDLAYLYRAIGNRCLNHIRDHKNRARLMQEHGDTTTAPRTTCDGVPVSVDLLAKLSDVLDARSLEVLVCLFIDDMSQEETASALKLSRKTVGKRLQKIRSEVAALSGETTEAAS